MFIKEKAVKISNGKRGSATVEAAVFLPVFFLAMLSIILLIRLIGAEESMMRICTQEAIRVEKEAYLTQLPMIPDTIGTEFAEGAAAGAVMVLRLRDKAEVLPVEKINCSYFRYLYEKNGIDGLICADLSYESEIPFPAGFQRTLDFEKKNIVSWFYRSCRKQQSDGFFGNGKGRANKYRLCVSAGGRTVSWQRTAASLMFTHGRLS